MTNEEQDLLIAYLVDAGELDPDCDLEGQVWMGPDGHQPGSSPLYGPRPPGWGITLVV